MRAEEIGHEQLYGRRRARRGDTILFHGSKTKLPTVVARKANEPNPYVVGKEGALRYLTTVDECAQAGLVRLSSQ